MSSLSPNEYRYIAPCSNNVENFSAEIKWIIKVICMDLSSMQLERKSFFAAESSQKLCLQAEISFIAIYS